MDSQFETMDYVIVVAAVVLSSAAGFYYGVIKKKNNSIDEYFLASRELSTIKMACSLFATCLTSGSLVGYVAEIYYYGLQPTVGVMLFIFCLYFYMKLLFPVFHKIGSFDLFKYYELRYVRHVRYFLSLLAIFDRLFANSIIVYGTSVVTSKVTGLHIWIIICALMSVCIFYSSLGGVRGVTLADMIQSVIILVSVVMDMIQSVIILVSVVMVCVLGIIQLGGLSKIWKINSEGDRTEFFNFSTNPVIRHTFWSGVIGQIILGICGISTSPTTTLRIMASNSIKKCIRASYIGTILMTIVYLLCAFIGMLAYTIFYNCDPILSGEIKTPNQLITLLVNKILTGYIGLKGLFYAGIICTAISTLSSNLNGLAVLTMETLVKPFCLVKHEENYTKLAKIIVVITGIASLLGIVLVERFPNVHMASLVLSSVTSAPQCGLLLIGMMFPQANLISAVGGFGIGFLFMIWLTIGSLFVTKSSVTKPLSISGCLYTFNSSMVNSSDSILYNMTSTPFLNLTSNPIMMASKTVVNPWITYFPLSTASYVWFATLGLAVTIIAFIAIAILSPGEKHRTTDINLIPIPFQNIHKKFSRRWRKFLLCDVYYEEIEIVDELEVEKLMMNNIPKQT